MPNLMKSLLLLALITGCGDPPAEPSPQANGQRKNSDPGEISVPDPSQELSRGQARELLSEAASLSREEFIQILNSPPMSIAGIKNQSLTVLLLAVDPLHAEKQNPSAIEDFQYLIANGQDPDRRLILAAIQGQGNGEYVSLIQPEYITDCTCQNRGDTAEGHVEYRAGNVYAGSADFTAKRQNDRWEIVAFHLPEYHLATRRQPDGTWRLESEEQLLGIAYP